MRFTFTGFTVLVVALTVATASAQDADPGPALGGYCPVAYVAMGKAVKGDPEFSLDHAGRRYLFANAQAREMFAADPASYQVAYDGYCATALSMGKLVESDPELFSRVNGTTYLFSSAEAKQMFDAAPSEHIARADRQWEARN